MPTDLIECALIPEIEIDPSPEDALHSTEVSTSRRRDKVRALYVDIDPFERQAFFRIAAACRQVELVVTPCRNVEEAQAALARQAFDVVFLEYWMGSSTSLPFIHEMAGGGGAPCVVLTDLNEPDIRRLAFRAGAVGFLAKASLGPEALESVTLAVLHAQDATA